MRKKVDFNEMTLKFYKGREEYIYIAYVCRLFFNTEAGKL